jgi:hypothetical protein
MPKPALRAVTAKPAPAKRWTVRPEWVHPDNEHHRTRYVAAIRFLRRGGRSRWLMDKPTQRLTEPRET